MNFSPSGLLEIASQAIAAPRLLVLPHLYDVASASIRQQYAAMPESVNKELLKAVDPKQQALTNRSVANDAKVAFQLVAPIGLNIVRLAALGSFLVAAGPVALVLGGAGALLTGKKTLEDIKRALKDDPAIRRHLQEAEDALTRDDLATAEQCLKDALAVDDSPDNPRNGDIYLRFGMLYGRMQRPRQALLAFARASVLFRNNQSLVIPASEGRVEIKLSKRGYTELMALNCLNAFALDESGLSEWSELANEFGQSAALKLEAFAREKDEGTLFSLFAGDPDSARYNRSLLAGIKFLQAKFATAKALEDFGIEQVTPSIDAGVAMVMDDENLTDDEKGNLILQQSHFFFAMAKRHPAMALSCLDVALELSRKGCALLDNADTVLQIRAEVMSWLVHAMPMLSQQNPSAISERLPGYRAEWGLLISQVQHSSLAGREEFLLWASDQLYRSAASREECLEAIEQGLSVTRQMEDDASAVHYALRMVFATKSAPAVEQLESAATRLASNADPLLRTYGLRYLANLRSGNDVEAATSLYCQAAEAADEACQELRLQAHSVPFLVQGRTVIHASREARVVIKLHSLYCLHEAGALDQLLKGLSQLERDLDVIDQPLAVLVMDALKAGLAFRIGDLSYGEHLRRKVLSIASPEQQSELQRLMGGEVTMTAIEDAQPDSVPPPQSLPQDDLERFEQSRQSLLSLVRSLETFFKEADFGGEVLHVLQEQRQRMEGVEFKVAIVGEFSTGKSTFLNALLGERLLPSAVRPTTSIINRLRYGEPGLQVVFHDGRQESISLDALRDYITEKLNPGNAKGVESVDIHSPIPLLKSGITLVDTPGVGSLFTSHTNTTLQLLPTCDAVVLITDATQPLAQSELVFLQRLKGVMSDRIFIVANKIDDLTPPQAAKAIGFIKENVWPLLPGARIYPISAYLALAAKRLQAGQINAADIAEDPFLQGVSDYEQLMQASRFSQLEQGLFQDLVSRKGVLLLGAVKDRITETLAGIGNDLKLRVRNLDRDLDDVNRRVEAVVDATRQTRQRLSRILDRLEADIRDIKSALWEQVRSEKSRILADVKERLETVEFEGSSHEDVLSELEDHIRRWLDESVQQANSTILARLDRASKSIMEVASDFEASFSRHFETTSVALWCGQLQSSPTGVEEASQGNGELALLSGGVGFLSVFLLGPVGVVAAVVGGFFLGMISQERQNARARQQLLEQITQLLDRAESSFRQHVGNVLENIAVREVEQMRREIERGMLNMDERMALMVTERQAAITDLSPTRERLGRLQASIESYAEKLEGVSL